MAKRDEYQSYLQDPNVRKVLDVISMAEGTDKNGYATAFGGGMLDSLADHPRKLYDFKQTDGKANKTSAAGKYQFLQSTWDDVASNLGLQDFGPESQDLAAIALLDRAGALKPAASGDFQTALQKSGSTWASLPTSPYAQPKRSEGFIEKALNAVIPAAQAAPAPQPKKWAEVQSSEKYQALTLDQKAAARQQYFDAVVAPRVPEGQLEAAKAQFMGQFGAPAAPKEPAVSDSSLVGIGAGLGKGVGTVALNAQNYLGKGLDAVGLETAGQWLQNDAQTGLKNLEAQVAPYKEVSPIATGGGEIAGNIAATLPVGAGLGALVSRAAPAMGAAAPYAQQLANSLRSGGMNLGGEAATGALGIAGNTALRAAGGAGTGYVSAGLVDPESANTGAIVGGAFPVAGQALAAGGQAIGRALRGGEVSEPVKVLANRAKDLGINIPADRIANSKPLNAAAASLNYVPFSGRAAVEEKMQDQLNRALTRTFGQNSDNVTGSLRQAETALGSEFDRVLKNTAVKVDDDFLNALAAAQQRAADELPPEMAGVISKQIENIFNDAAASKTGALDGQLAYNYKRTLDRIGQRNSPEGYYASELRKDLVEALNRSLGPDEAASFAKTRQQYGNMLSLRQLAQNGVEGDISIARLANMRNIRNPELQELADIAAQFLRPRESAHSAGQRVTGGLLTAGVGGVAGIPAAAAGIGVGRMANSALNSDTLRNAMLGQPGNMALANALRQALPATARTLPVLTAQ